MRPNFLYLFRGTTSGLIKIGVSQDPVGRLSRIQVDEATEPLDLVDMAAVDEAYRLETTLHRRYAAKRREFPSRVVRRSREWFALTEAELAEVRQLLSGASA